MLFYSFFFVLIFRLRLTLTIIISESTSAATLFHLVLLAWSLSMFATKLSMATLACRGSAMTHYDSAVCRAFFDAYNELFSSMLFPH